MEENGGSLSPFPEGGLQQYWMELMHQTFSFDWLNHAFLSI
jgi:hypothetical protein